MNPTLKKFTALTLCFLLIFTLFAGCKAPRLDGQDDPSIYINGQSADGLVTVGVKGGTGNLFEPNSPVEIVVWCKSEKLNGQMAKITVDSSQADFYKTYELTLKGNFKNTVSFTSEKNGIFNVEVELPSKERYSFNLAVMPKNAMASDEFYYGIQPYFTRSYLWGEGFCLPNYDGEKSIELMLDAAEYMGINLVREDNVSWGGMQSGAYAEVDLSMQDFIINKINERGMKANIIFGFNADKWSVADRFKSTYDSNKGWTYMPNLDIWLDYANKVADHYKNNNNILWEIWNEPNWEPFFTGTQEEYFSLLEATAKALKKANPNAYVFSGGLAVAERSSNLPYYQKAAQLIADGVLDSYGYHNHDGGDTYYDNMQLMTSVTEDASLTVGGINSESGVYGGNPALLACKALYTRAAGGKGFVSFAFRKSVTPENDINDYAYFNEYLQPTESVLTYSTVIRFLGSAKLEGSESSQKNLQIDRYSANGKKILVYYSLGTKSTTPTPEGKFTAYDMYGNPIELGDTISVTAEPTYLIFE